MCMHKFFLHKYVYMEVALSAKWSGRSPDHAQGTRFESRMLAITVVFLLGEMMDHSLGLHSQIACGNAEDAN